MEKNYYETLGLQPGASLKEIKKAYRALAQAYHPDLNNGHDTEEIFFSVSEAYGVLSNRLKRREYDKKNNFPEPKATEEIDADIIEEIKESLRKEAEARQQPTTKQPTKTNIDLRNTQPSKTNIKQSLNFEKFGNLNNPDKENNNINVQLQSNLQTEPEEALSLFKKILRPLTKAKAQNIVKSIPFESQQNPNPASVKKERTYSLALTAEESLKESKREIAIDYYGQIEKVELTIPPLTSDTIPKRITTKLPNGKEVDLSISILITKTDLLERDGLDLILSIPITISEYINGHIFDVPTLKGSKSVTLLPYHNLKNPIIIESAGLMHESTGNIGALKVKFQIAMPDRQSDQLKNAAQIFDSFYLDHPRANLKKTLT